MAALSIGNRVSVRYRLPAGADKPFTDAVGYVDALTREGAEPHAVLRTKSGEILTIGLDSIVAVRELSHVPVRASEIRALEHAAALAWPGVRQQWVGGWFCRAGDGADIRANSAVPLDVSAQVADLAAVTQWYREQGRPAWLELPERLLPMRGVLNPRAPEVTRVMTRDIPDGAAGAVGADAVVTGAPDARWRELSGEDLPVGVLTSVLDGAVGFTTVADAAVGRGAVTPAPDGTRWLGISQVHTVAQARRRGHARAVCEALLHWGAEQQARRAYVQVAADDPAAVALVTALGFRLHHCGRFLPAQALLEPGEPR